MLASAVLMREILATRQPNLLAGKDQLPWLHVNAILMRKGFRYAGDGILNVRLAAPWIPAGVLGNGAAKQARVRCAFWRGEIETIMVPAMSDGVSLIDVERIPRSGSHNAPLQR